MIYFRWLQPTAGFRKKQGFSQMFSRVFIFPCNVAKAIFLHFQFNRQLKQTAIVNNWDWRFNVVYLIKTDFDYAQSDSHPERSRRVFEITFFWFYP